MAIQIKVLGYHIDVFQHVNNARYLEFYEADRWDWMGKANLIEWAIQHKIIMAAVNINVNYFQAVGLGDELTVTSKIDKIGVNSAVCYQQIIRHRNGEDEVVSDAYVTFVFIDGKSNKAMVIEDELHEKIESLKNKIDACIEV